MSESNVLFSRTWDEEEARGTVELLDGAYGPTLRVNGRDVLFVDLFPPTEETPGPVQLIVDSDEDGDEPVAKIILTRPVVVTLHKDCERLSPEGACPIHHGGPLYGLPPVDETDGAEDDDQRPADEFRCQNCDHVADGDEFIPSDGNPAPRVCPECGSTDCFLVTAD